MSYDHWKTTEPDPNDDGERDPPPGPEEAWEFWCERAHKFEAVLRELHCLLDFDEPVTNDKPIIFDDATGINEAFRAARAALTEDGKP